ncbi:MAG: hypothetical protein Q9227_002985 [Pyrenula ochraceoflavens]
MLPYIDAPFNALARSTGASVDELKVIASFLLSYPLAAALKRIPDTKPWQKNVFICGVSIFYLVGLFDLWDGVRTLLYTSVGAYTISYYLDGSLMPWIGFIFLMGHMSINHIYRQIANSPSSVDITGAQMVLVMKLTSFCWNVHDGRLPENGLSDYQKKTAIREFPGVLDFAGYVLFFPSLFAGPAFDYNDYRSWIETTMFDISPGMDPTKRPVTRKQRRIPRSGTPAAMKALLGIVWIFAFLKFSAWYNVDFFLGDEFPRYGLLRRIWQLQMLGFTTRLKYYGVWSLTEGACILSGMGYNGVDPKTGKVYWNRLENVNPWGIESAQNSRAFLENWNKNTNNWLRYSMYLRVTPKGKRPGFRASLATFTASAFWHGFYPGYYLTFTLAAFIQTVAKNFRRHVRPLFLSPDGKKPLPSKRWYDILSYLATQMAFCFTTAPFVILSFPNSIKVWARVYFYCIIGVAASMAFFASPAKQWLDQRVKKHIQPGLQRSHSEESLHHPSLGLPSDPGRDVDEAVQEIKQEVETRRRRGSKVTMPTGEELVKTLEDKLGRKIT